MLTAAPPPPPRPVPLLKAAGFGPLFFLLFGAIWAFVGIVLVTVFVLVFGVTLHIVLPAVFAVVGVVLIVVGVVLARPRHRAYRDGVATRATITAHRATHARQDHRPVVDIVYSFTTPSGAACEGKWPTIAPPPVGTEIWILFDPEEPRHNLPA